MSGRDLKLRDHHITCFAAIALTLSRRAMVVVQDAAAGCIQAAVPLGAPVQLSSSWAQRGPESGEHTLDWVTYACLIAAAPYNIMNCLMQCHGA